MQNKKLMEGYPENAFDGDKLLIGSLFDVNQ